MRRADAFLIIGFVILASAIPIAYATACGIQIDSVDHPTAVSPSQNFSITTSLTITCSKASLPISGRLDIVDASSGVAISTQSLRIGYVGGESATFTQVVISSVRAPGTSIGYWPLNIHVILFISGMTLAETYQALIVQVGATSPPETFAEVQILQNGGFENGLTNWVSIASSGSGSIAISDANMHSGSSALTLTLFPPLPGTSPLAAVVLGVEQTTSVYKLRDIRIDGWYQTRIDSTLAAARLRVQVSELAINYYVAFGPNTRITNAGTDTTQNIMISEHGCQTWCEISRNIGDDFRSFFSSDKIAASFNNAGSVPVTVALELLGYIGMTDNQFIQWDDVQAVVSVPRQTTTTTSTAQQTTTEITVSTSSLTPLISTLERTVTETRTVQVITTEQIYGGLAAIFGAGFLISSLLLIKTRKKFR